MTTQLSLLAMPAPAVLPPAHLLTIADLPPMVRGKTLWQPWAGLVAAVPDGETVGLKSDETRKQTIAPGFLVACAGLHTDEEWMDRLLPRVPAWALPLLKIRGHALALLLIGESRPLVPEDEPRAWFYAPGRKAMRIERCWPFKKPFKQRGIPGEFKIARETVLEAMQ